MIRGGIQNVKYGYAVVCVAFLAALTGANAPAARAEGPRHAAMVIDANSGKVLHDANADEKRYPASLTKLMTLYLVFEAIEQERLTLDSQITVSAAATSVAPSKLGLEAGETISVADAIKALVTKSANDMAVAVAEKIAGGEREFASLMTKKARQIGMNSTTFRNASGLPDTEQQTTARDMLTLALRIYDDFPSYARVFSLREFTYAGKTYRTHNTLMKSFPGMDGMKTGYTTASGFNLVASVRRDGKHIIGAVFGGATASSRNAHMRLILTKALEDASTEKTRRATPRLIASARPVERPARTEPRAEAVRQPPPAVKLAAASPPAPQAAKKPAAKAAVAAKPAEAIPNPAPVARKPTAPQVVQQVSVTPPVEAAELPTSRPQPSKPNPAEPTQTVSVSPPMVIATVKTIPIAGLTTGTAASPAEKGDKAPAAANEPNIATAERSTASPSISVSPPAMAAATPKLDFAALKQAIAGAVVPTAPPAATSAPANTRAPAATAPPRGDETVVAKVGAAPRILPPDAAPALGRPPSTLGAQVAMLQSGSVNRAASPANGVAMPVGFAPARPPSTLADQAANQTATSAQPLPVAAVVPPMNLNGPDGTIAKPAVQIGAYVSQQDAEKQLAEAQSKAPAVLGPARPFSRRIESNGRTLYAARFGGFEQADASKACLALRQLSIDCMVVQSK